MDRDAALARADQLDAEVGARLRFVFELDRLKSVLRQTLVLDGARRENSAEHSWHVALTAWAMAPFADDPIDVERVVKMLLVHDIVEIDAGDTFIYDEEARASAAAAERVAADRIFELIPGSDGAELRALWDEYEEQSTSEARFAYACDRLQPMLLNVAGGGGSWRHHGVTFDQVREVNGRIAGGSERIWSVARALLEATFADIEDEESAGGVSSPTRPGPH